MFFNVPWVSDMLDVSGGAGSWNLSMNQGLAHMQANLYMNSCWSSGFTFRPYDNLSMMSYLLNPAYASWQAINGISSNNNSIFGNFNNFNNSFNPWSGFNNAGGGSGSGSSNLTSEEEKHKTKCADLERFLKAYIEYKKEDGTLDDSWRIDVEKIMNKSVDSTYTYEKKHEDLLKWCNAIDPTNMKNFLLGGKLDLTGSNLYLLKLLAEAGFDSAVEKYFENDKDTPMDIARNIQERLKNVGQSDSNLAVTDDVFQKNNEYILAIISYYNSNCTSANLMADINSKWPKDDKDTTADHVVWKDRGNVADAMNKVAKALVDKANKVKSQYNEETQKLIKGCTDKLATQLDAESTLAQRNDYIATFNKLYQILRYAGVKKAEAIFKNTYGEITESTLFGTTSESLTEQTKADLGSEKQGTTVSPTDIGNIGASKAPTDGTPVNLNANKEKTEESGKDSTPVKKEEEVKLSEVEEAMIEHGSIIKECDTPIAGEYIFKWHGGSDQNPKSITDGELCTIDSDGHPQPLTAPQKRLLGVKNAIDMDEDIGGKQIFKWNGPETCNNVEIGELCIIENEKPRSLTDDEALAYELKNLYTEDETITYVDGKEYKVYYWRHTPKYADIKNGEPYILVENKPVGIPYEEE